MNHAEAYQRSYDRIRSLVDEQSADIEVPTCPGWTVKDLIAHQADFFDASKSGDPKEAFSDGWGDRGVKKHSEHSLQQCLDEVAGHLKDPGDIFEGQLAGVAVSDILAHEQDIRNALDKPGARDDENIVPSVEMALMFIEQKAKSEGLPAFKVVTEDIDRQIGEGEPQATLKTSTFDLFRAVQGRRTVDQVKAMDWEGDPDPWMKVFFIFGPTERQVEAA